jgi:hypothetical protein
MPQYRHTVAGGSPCAEALRADIHGIGTVINGGLAKFDIFRRRQKFQAGHALWF